LPASPSVYAIDLVMEALALYRLTRLVTKDAITQGLRDAVERAERERVSAPDHDKVAAAVRWGEEVAEVGPRTYLVNCPWCASVWLAVGVAIARRVAPLPWRLAARVLAGSAVAGALGEHL
jgi:hypothetical protein